MKKLLISQYIKGSKSAKNLQMWLRANGFPRLKRMVGGMNGRFIINWGNSVIHCIDGTFVNKPLNVAIAGNKHLTFVNLLANGVSIPEFTTDMAVANQWASEGHIVIGRKLLRASAGNGIVVFEPNTTIAYPCPLYVKYKKKKAEYRVHVINGEVVDVAQKKRTVGKEADTLIRSHLRGWTFCKQNIVVPDDVKVQAIKAVQSLGLDFGGVDVIWNEKEGRSYVLEVNCAPGLEGSTVKSYGNAIKQLILEKNV